jgi:protein-S-isoprenylcysteine O-methyltransferase Ste14
VISFSAVALFVWAVIILFYVFLCKYEEKILIEKFGKEYEQYKLETPMLLPRPIRRKK